MTSPSSEQTIMVAGTILAVILGWILNSLMTSLQIGRAEIRELIDQVAILEVRVEQLAEEDHEHHREAQ